MSPTLFQPLALRELTLKNRVVISPMCTYSAVDGIANDFHFVHLGRFALGGAGLVIVEATAVQAQGRITHGDMGLWNDAQVAPLARIAQFIKQQGAAAGIQLAHAGRKASMQRPWHGNGPLDASDAARGDSAWPIVAPSAEPVDTGWLTPKEMTADDIAALVQDFRAAARRAAQAGFDMIELHSAHGYLLHTFLSPLSNHRSDAYGGDLAGRMRLPLEVARALREEWPASRPAFVRISSVDGVEGGWSIDDSIAYARELRALGIDVIDCSSGGIASSPTASIVPRGYGFQVPFAQQVREGADIKTMAVGLIVDARQAEQVLQRGQADLVAVGREALAEPNWPVQAQTALAADVPARERYAGWAPAFGWWLGRRAATVEKLGAWKDEGG